MRHYLLSTLLFIFSGVSQYSGAPYSQPPLPVPPAGAVVLSNMQSTTNPYGTWTQCNTTACSGSAAGATGTSAFVNVSSPSLSGKALQITSTTTAGGYFNTLTYMNMACSVSPTGTCVSGTDFHFILSFDVYMPVANGSLAQTYEFDPDVKDGSNSYYHSFQCRASDNLWYLWNMNVNGWKKTSHGCSLITHLGTWHHIDMSGSFSQVLKTYSYDTFIVDNQVKFAHLNQQFPAPANAASAVFVVESQIDGSSATTGTLVVLLDNMNMTLWV